MKIEKRSISFFRCSEHRKGITLDEEVLEGITDEDLESLSEEEQLFVRWYRVEKNEGLICLNLFSHPMLQFSADPLADIPQQIICEEFMRMQLAPDLPDPDVLGNHSP